MNDMNKISIYNKVAEVTNSSPIIMVFASVLRKNRFIKVISFNDSKHSCYYLGP